MLSSLSFHVSGAGLQRESICEFIPRLRLGYQEGLFFPIDLSLEKWRPEAIFPLLILRKKATWKKADSEMKIWPGDMFDALNPTWTNYRALEILLK